MAEKVKVDENCYRIEGELNAKKKPIYHCVTCDKPFATSGAVRMHRLWKHQTGATVEKPGQVEKPAGGKGGRKMYTCPVCGSPVILLLKTNPRHQAAIAAGGVYACTRPDCEEVLKADGSQIG